MDLVDDGLDSMVAGSSAAKLEAVLPYADVQVIVNDIEVIGGNFVVGEKLGDGQAGLVHIGSGDGKVAVTGMVETGLKETSLPKLGVVGIGDKTVDNVLADIVARVEILGVGVAQADKEHELVYHWRNVGIPGGTSGGKRKESLRARGGSRVVGG